MGKEKQFIIMIPISEEEELLLDVINKNIIKFIRGDKTFNITRRNVYCYGEVDFHNNEDLNKIDKFKILGYLNEVGIRIFAKYDYNTHICKTNTNHVKWSETWRFSDIVKYAHGCLQKPKRILLFNQTTK